LNRSGNLLSQLSNFTVDEIISAAVEVCGLAVDFTNPDHGSATNLPVRPFIATS
jgi:hypothetical protein